MENNAYTLWKEYVAKKRKLLEPELALLGYELEELQPHVSGERYLMRAVTTTSGRKLIFIGTDTKTRKKVVIKAAREGNGKEELRHERASRIAIHELPFAYQIFTSPKECFFGERAGFLISIQEYIDQTTSFLERPLTEQFTYALRAFKAQEGAHAATYEQLRVARRVFGSTDASTYLKHTHEFASHIREAEDVEKYNLTELYAQLRTALTSLEERITQYGNFLTHTDFVPHNFRIKVDTLYLLDYSALRFGNKHEGWARFLNFMSLHNPELEAAFLQYFQDNRAPEECESLHAMRLYRLGEIIWYYVRNVPNSTGDLRTLTLARVEFWSQMLRAHLENSAVPKEVREHYIRTRDSLRSEEERLRQKDLH